MSLNLWFKRFFSKLTKNNTTDKTDFNIQFTFKNSTFSQKKNVITLKNLLTREQFTDISVEDAGKIILESKN